MEFCSVKRVIKSLEKEVFTRIGVSKIHGVGVFAVKPIPKGCNPFYETRSADFIAVPVKNVTTNPRICDGVKQMVNDFAPEVDGAYYLPQYSLNELGTGFYLNHSDSPNMQAVNDGEDFIALRDIEVGEELTVDYETYSEKNL